MRVYGVTGAPGELDARGCKVFTHTGARIRYANRVEFDADADSGMATVTAIMTDEAGDFLVDVQKGEACHVTFRTWVRLVQKGQPDPPKTPDVMLWDAGDGRIVAGEDPMPAVPCTVNAVGG